MKVLSRFVISTDLPGIERSPSIETVFSTVMVSMIHVWADEDGESHLEDLDLEFEEADFVPPAPPVLLTSLEPASGYAFERVPPGWHGDWHPAPRRVLAIYLAGQGSIEASDGETRPLVPGTILLAEDTTGRGHITKVTGSDEMFVVIVTLPG